MFLEKEASELTSDERSNRPSVAMRLKETRWQSLLKKRITRLIMWLNCVSWEIVRLRKLAVWGREYIKGSRHTRAPVILLTGTELFASHSLNSTWEKKGSKHKELCSRSYVRLDQLKTLANLTQQLYLNMPSYSDWLEKKWETRQAKLLLKI